jgi:hypothetical protein
VQRIKGRHARELTFQSNADAAVCERIRPL